MSTEMAEVLVELKNNEIMSVIGGDLVCTNRATTLLIVLMVHLEGTLQILFLPKEESTLIQEAL